MKDTYVLFLWNCPLSALPVIKHYRGAILLDHRVGTFIGRRRSMVSYCDDEKVYRVDVKWARLPGHAEMCHQLHYPQTWTVVSGVPVNSSYDFGLGRVNRMLLSA